MVRTDDRGPINSLLNRPQSVPPKSAQYVFFAIGNGICPSLATNLRFHDNVVHLSQSIVAAAADAAIIWPYLSLSLTSLVVGIESSGLDLEIY